MLHFPAPEEENDAFLNELRAMGDSIEPPSSLAPEQIRNRLPDPNRIPLTRRIAPYAAMAACLAVVLTGVRIFQQNQASWLRSGNTSGAAASSQAAAQANDALETYVDGLSEGAETAEGGQEECVQKTAPPNTAKYAASAPDYTAVYEAVQDNATAESFDGAANEQDKASLAHKEAIRFQSVEYSLTEDGELLVFQGEAEARAVSLELPGGSWTAQSLLLAGTEERLIVLGEGLSDSGMPCSIAAFYDISVPSDPVYAGSYAQSGSNCQAVLSGGVLILQSIWIPANVEDGSDPGQYVPAVYQDGGRMLFYPAEIPLLEGGAGSGYLVLTAADIRSGSVQSRLAGYGPLSEVSLSEKGVQWNGACISWEGGVLSLAE